MVAKDTGEKRALAWHHNLRDLMQGPSCGLDLLQIVCTKHRNPEQNYEVMTSGSSNDMSNSSVLRESVRIEFKPCSKSATIWPRNEESSHPGSSGKWLSNETLPLSPG